MLRWQRIQIGLDEWNKLLEEFPHRTVFQSAAWLGFLKDTVGGELIFANLRDGNASCGYFAGMIVRKFGLRILGSPLPGWTTSYMGLLLNPEISQLQALDELKRFAFEDLRCVHLEVMDRQFARTSLDSQYQSRSYNGFEINLSLDEDHLFSNFTPACRRCVRKASRCGVLIEEAEDADFAGEYYEQLQDVFAKQKLAPTYTIDRVLKLISHLKPTGNLLLLRARDNDGRCIATGIFPAMNDRAYFWGGASWREHQHLRPNDALMWYAIRYWKKRGMQRFDFSGAGDYKRKYGPYEISVPWLRISRYPLLPAMRNGMLVLTRLQQRWQGLWQSSQSPIRTAENPPVHTPETANV